MPYFNLCWGLSSLEDLQYAQKFFAPYTFCLMNDNAASFPLGPYFQTSIERLDMEIDLSAFKEGHYTHPLDIRLVTTKEDLTQFAFFLGNNNVDFHKDALKVVDSLSQSCSFYLAYMEGKPVGRAMYYLDENKNAGIYLTQVSEAYRGRGIGRKLVLKCLTEAKAKGAQKAIVSAPRSGWGLCHHLNFVPLSSPYTLRISTNFL